MPVSQVGGRLCQAEGLELSVIHLVVLDPTSLGYQVTDPKL